MEEKKGRIIGIDLAKRTYVAWMEDEELNLTKDWQGTTSEKGLKQLITRLRPTDKVALECCSFAFYLAKRIMKESGSQVFVLNPRDLAVIYRSTKKTDLEDSRKLAWILRRFPVEELPMVKLPTEQEEHRRALVSELQFKKKSRTRLINRLHSLFVRLGKTDLTKKDLVSHENRLDQMEFLSGFTAAEALRMIEELQLLEKHIGLLDEEIRADLKQEPLVPHLVSIPGVGITTAMAFLAYCGDGSRFRDGRQVAYYTGITPRVDNSGETVRLGNITKRGCTAIRSVIVQAAWAVVRTKKETPLQKKYYELAARRGNGRAIVAIARRMLELMWLMVAKKDFYNRTSKEDLEKKLRLLRLKEKEKKLVEPAA
jgi:transposase